MSKHFNGKFDFSTDGAFKNVDVYDYYVYKYSKEGDEGYRMSESEARDHSWCYDDDGNFHYSWVYTQLDDDEVSSDESYEELSNEYNYAMAKKHMKIIVPILDGDETAYYMPRVSKMGEDASYYRSTRGRKEHINRIKKAVLVKYNKLARGQKTLESVSYRVDKMISFGIQVKLSDKRIINNMFWFLVEDHYNGLLTDMHSSNFGLYHGNIAAFDLGRSSYMGYSRKSSPRTSDKKQSTRNRVNSIRWTAAYRKMEKDYNSRRGSQNA